MKKQKAGIGGRKCGGVPQAGVSELFREPCLSVFQHRLDVSGRESLYVGKIDSPEVRSSQVSPPKIDVPEFGLLEPCPHEVSPLKICPSQVRPFEIHVLQAGIPEFSALEGDILESTPLDIDLFPIFPLRRNPLQMPFQDPLQLSLCFHDIFGPVGKGRIISDHRLPFVLSGKEDISRHDIFDLLPVIRFAILQVLYL